MADCWIDDAVYDHRPIIRSKSVLFMGGDFWGQLVAENVCIDAISLPYKIVCVYLLDTWASSPVLH